ATTLATEGQPGSYESMMAVGTIIMNRVESDGYPDTLEEVIYQPMQFEATWLHPNFKQYLNLGAPNLANEVARDLLQGKRDPRLIMPKCTQFRTDKPYYRSQYPNGISIGGNWYFW
ncbi:MAG: cell wall hydrolase, partial [Lachnospiraceae bacterium]|nr:cell wall hydrolase [Lachnospiraceae bacterium]